MHVCVCECVWCRFILSISLIGLPRLFILWLSFLLFFSFVWTLHKEWCISKLYAMRTTITSHNALLLFIQWTQETMEAPIGTPELKAKKKRHKYETHEQNHRTNYIPKLVRLWIRMYNFLCVYVCVLFSYANDLCVEPVSVFFFLLLLLRFITAVAEAVIVVTILLWLSMLPLSSSTGDNHSSRCIRNQPRTQDTISNWNGLKNRTEKWGRREE